MANTLKKLPAVLFLLCMLYGFTYKGDMSSRNLVTTTDTLPVALPANFTDDYGIRYSINDTVWLQQPSVRYHILRWNTKEQYIIARNGINNPSEEGLYTRIDYMKFNNMEPFLWGFCLSTYNAKSDSLAEHTPIKTDRLNPRKGCNGYPFSRMKKVD